MIETLAKALLVDPGVIRGWKEPMLFISGKRIKEAREKIGLSVNSLAKKIKGADYHIQLLEENSFSRVSLSAAQRIADSLKVTVEYLVGTGIPLYFNDNDMLSKKAQRVGLAYEKATQPVQRTVEVALEPYMDEDESSDSVVYVYFSQSELRSSAGKGAFLDEESMRTVKVRLDLLPKGYEKDPSRYFGVPITGDSMEPRYHDGDTLVVSREPVNVGEIGVFTLDGSGYVKQFVGWALRTLNPEYEDIPLTEDVRCNGKVVGVLCPEDILEK